MILLLVTVIGVVVATVAIHGLAVMLLFNIARKPLTLAKKLTPHFRLGISCFFVIGFVLAHIVEIVLWAAAYRLAGELQSFEEAVYFSAVTFATIGYGDITLSSDGRLASALEGVNGILLFGWTTAFLFKVSEFLWVSQGVERRKAASP
jgi:hypothetical protein